MSIETQLDRLREDDRAVESAMYVDLRSGMVLYSSAATRPPQERLDAVAAAAVMMLGGEAGEATEVVTMAATGAMVLRRSGVDPAEAVCLVCAPDVSVARAMEAARGIGDGA